MLLLLAPGQGSQTPGMLAPWLPDAGATVARWSDRCGLDLADLGTHADAEAVRATEVAQPLLVASALLSGRALLDGRDPDLVCGHSVGELAALALAGVLDDDDAVALAAGRGAAMAEAAAQEPGGMLAVLGGDLDDVTRAAEQADLEVATVNGRGQVVLGGPVTALEAFEPPGRVRLRRLDVAGAFHTRLMRPARERFATLLADLSPTDARCPVVANADGARETDGGVLVRRLAAQLTSPVRFDLCLSGATDAGADRAVELAPGGTLAGLVRRGLPGVPAVALHGPEDLGEAAALLGEAPDPAGADRARADLAGARA